jgi:uncharacterized protein YbaR (Trm112 family)
MVDESVLTLLRCPKTHQPLMIAPKDVLEVVNDLIASGEIASGRDPSMQELLFGFLTTDRRWLYPVWDGIPALIGEEAIEIGSPLST